MLYASAMLKHSTTKIGKPRTHYSAINMRNECRQPWIHNCISFKKLYETCEVINFCAWTGGHGRVRKLTKPTANVFFVSATAAALMSTASV